MRVERYINELKNFIVDYITPKKYLMSGIQHICALFTQMQEFGMQQLWSTSLLNVTCNISTNNLAK